jgi:hypothetical protein
VTGSRGSRAAASLVCPCRLGIVHGVRGCRDAHGEAADGKPVAWSSGFLQGSRCQNAGREDTEHAVRAGQQGGRALAAARVEDRGRTMAAGRGISLGVVHFFS